MGIIEKFKNKLKSESGKSKIVFFTASFLYIIFTYLVFIGNYNKNEYYNFIFRYSTYILKNLERNFEEKNLTIKFENDTFSINTNEPLILENYDQRIAKNKNLLYIAKDSDIKEFKEKDTFAILNSKVLKINFESGVIEYPIEGFKNIKEEIKASDFKSFNQKFYEGSDYYNSVAFNILAFFKSFEILFLFFVCSVILPYLVFSVLYLSGYKNLDYKFFRNNSFLWVSIYLILKPFFTVFSFEVTLTNVMLILTILISIQEKNKLEKN